MGLLGYAGMKKAPSIAKVPSAAISAANTYTAPAYHSSFASMGTSVMQMAKAKNTTPKRKRKTTPFNKEADIILAAAQTVQVHDAVKQKEAKQKQGIADKKAQQDPHIVASLNGIHNSLMSYIHGQIEHEKLDLSKNGGGSANVASAAFVSFDEQGNQTHFHQLSGLYGSGSLERKNATYNASLSDITAMRKKVDPTLTELTASLGRHSEQSLMVHLHSTTAISGPRIIDQIRKNFPAAPDTVVLALASHPNSVCSNCEATLGKSATQLRHIFNAKRFAVSSSSSSPFGSRKDTISEAPEKPILALGEARFFHRQPRKITDKHAMPTAGSSTTVPKTIAAAKKQAAPKPKTKKVATKAHVKKAKKGE